MIKTFKILFHLFIAIFALSLSFNSVFGQGCTIDVPVFNVDLIGNPDSIWIVEDVDRSGTCCDFQSPNSCLKFKIKIDSEAKGIIFSITGGTMPSNTDFQLMLADETGCESNTYKSKGVLCLVPETTYSLIFCQPDGNHNDFTIKSVPNSTLPVISLTGKYAEGCQPFEVTFYDSKATKAETFNWQFGDGTSSTESMPYHVYSDTGKYNVSLTITYDQNCQATSDDIFVNVLHNPEIVVTHSPEKPDMANPEVSFNISTTGIIQALWDFGDGDTSSLLSPTHSFPDSGKYSITVLTTNSLGCENKSSFKIEIATGNYFEIPTAFMPNPESSCGGIYDIYEHNNYVFYPIVEYVQSYNFQVYNRWGEMIFNSDDLSIGWDGYYKGTLCKQDVYVWKIEIIYLDGTHLKKAGNVTLLR